MSDFAVTYVSPLGNIQLLSNGRTLCGVHTAFWKGNKAKNRIHQEGSSLECLKEASHWLDIYFGGKIPDFTPPLELIGTDFQKEVWNILLTIQYGKLMTYGEIADIIAKRRKVKKISARAVGGAVGANPIGIIVPCHRVIGKGGNLTGYAGGLKTKVKLMELEGIDTNKLYFPKRSSFL